SSRRMLPLPLPFPPTRGEGMATRDEELRDPARGVDPDSTPAAGRRRRVHRGLRVRSRGFSAAVLPVVSLRVRLLDGNRALQPRGPDAAHRDGWLMGHSDPAAARIRDADPPLAPPLSRAAPLRFEEPLRMGASGGGPPRSDPETQGSVSERPFFHRPRSSLSGRLGPARVLPEPVVGRTGPSAFGRPGPEAAAALFRRSRG